ncbi:unnamed protein product [Miscanthus lutarioriparius]|uniref:Uncharacterized protein n=1 Tax=Miscanthus lutarioriparius TaxID=422564 RepID=A0A811RW61_9POAL|nr:unnamed protein product [Miscanthus lutarioriparius]
MGNCVCQASRHGGVPGTADGEPVWAERGETCEEGKTKSVKVTVRMSKSRLQKLMASRAGGGEGMTLGKVLAEIVSAGEVVVDVRCCRRRWEPALESIPEAMESRDVRCI